MLFISMPEQRTTLACSFYMCVGATYMDRLFGGQWEFALQHLCVGLTALYMWMGLIGGQ